jgi:hypothetical protein
MNIIDREIIYDDEWIYDPENQLYINVCSDEVLTEEEFEYHQMRI